MAFFALQKCDTEVFVCLVDLRQQKPQLGVSPVRRGLGLHGEPRVKAAVRPSPHVAHCLLDQHAICLVLASNALFIVLRPADVRVLILEVSPTSFSVGNSLEYC